MKQRPAIVYTPHSIAAKHSYVYWLIEKTLAERADVIAAVTPSERDELHKLDLLPRERIRIVVPTIPATGSRHKTAPALATSWGWAGAGRRCDRAVDRTEGSAVVRRTCIGAARTGARRARRVGRRRRTARPGRGANIGVAVGVVRIDTGWLDDVRSYIAAANVFISTSRYESFGYATAEALAMARPVVASNITGTIDVVRSDVDAQLFALETCRPPLDASRFHPRPSLAEAVAHRGRDYVNAAFSVARRASV